ncbi:hypothetical protein [Allokutzneria albata]|uniref:DUF2637 domain-containing protein n=1 Tax=Allokutzneria albata TaxID=211114 RepID=A0A1H0CB40_ALLAB|nr:hypothetical protein [Allokutzneria albata]SDN55098.1 hypothetical protein SAMN04489726_7124 [Allokutzneria albata]
MQRNKDATDDTAGETRRVRKLVNELAESHRLHALATDPRLNAVKIDRFRTSITRCMWFFLACGLGFTTTGVHEFLAGDRGITDPMWWGAWLVEPALAGILITVLRWEAEILSRSVSITESSVTWLKRVLLGATLFMNVYPTLSPREGTTVSTGTVFVHIVIPIIVYLIAQVMPVIQQTCTEAKDRVADLAPAPAARRAIPSDALAALKLPPQMAAAISAKAAEAAAQGRAITPADVQAAVKVPDSFAARIVTQLTSEPTFA